MAAPLQIGDPAPDFRLPSSAGQDLSLASFSGKKLVLYFYPKDDTSGCTRQALDFNALRPEFAEAQTEIVGVSPDGLASHEAFKTKYKLTFALGSAKPSEFAMLTGSGRKNPCTAGSIWAWGVQPS